ncbi:flavin reductase family protein [Agaribacter flavus]|uniref:Flavin reductase family protein n=1 Tax=Agaribacter flavus TaxID=1902781 RepID=A0ABV7FQ56_9ALTE
MMNNTMIVTQNDIENMDSRYRAHFVNCLSGFKSANLIGTCSKDGIDNLCIVSSVFHLGSHPPLLGMIMRPHTVPRDTLKNIKDTGQYTVNHVHAALFEQAHQSSARYPSEESEFAHLKLNPLRSSCMSAPFVAESHLRIALKVRDIVEIAANNTELIIGEVIEVNVPDHSVLEDGFIDLEALNTVTVSGLDSYHQTTCLDRLSYAKPDTPLTSIKK